MYCVMRASVPSLYNVYLRYDIRLPLSFTYLCTLKLVELANKSNKLAEEVVEKGLARLSVGRAERTHNSQKAF